MVTHTVHLTLRRVRSTRLEGCSHFARYPSFETLAALAPQDEGVRVP
jgi:hypothetical protein